MTIIKHEPWECPRCKTINAPWLSQCTCKPEVKEDNRNIATAIKKCESDSDHDWRCIGISSIGDTYRCSKCGETKEYLYDGSVVKV